MPRQRGANFNPARAERAQERNAPSREAAGPRRYWEQHEDQAVLTRSVPGHGSDLDDIELARILGRSRQAIEVRRCRIRKAAS